MSEKESEWSRAENAEDFKSMTGQGVTGRIEGRMVALGNEHMMRELGVAIDATATDVDVQNQCR